LVFCGRIPEAEKELVAALSTALEGEIPQDRIEEWFEAVVPALRAAGPRPSTIALLEQWADKARDAKATGVELLLTSLVVELELARGMVDRARSEADRATRLARRSGNPWVQALALYAAGISRLNGSLSERTRAIRFLQSAEELFRSARRYAYLRQVEEILLDVAVDVGAPREVVEARERGIAATQRPRNPLLELYHTLGWIELVMRNTVDRKVEAAIRRAHEIVERHHLLPPSPLLLRLWLIEGAAAALRDERREARDRFGAIADLPSGMAPPAARAEALRRLRDLETDTGDAARIEALDARLAGSEIAAAPGFTRLPRHTTYNPQHTSKENTGPPSAPDQPTSEGKTPGQNA